MFIDFYANVSLEPVAPFTVGVASTALAQTNSLGFNIAYSQVPCS
jgi:hypothetical protein